MPLAVPIKRALARADLTTTVHAVATIARTLAGLHHENIFHRDIKPANLFRLKGAWVIGDFGLVDYPDKDAITAPGKRLGPQNFIPWELLKAPESAHGGPVDVYLMAKTLWVLATGQTYPPPGPHRTEDVQTRIETYVDHPKVRFLDQLMESATRHDPASRSSMQRVADELFDWCSLSNDPVPIPDTDDLFDKLSRLTEPGRTAQQTQMAKHAQFRELVSAIERRVSPIQQGFKDAGCMVGSLSPASSGTASPSDGAKTIGWRVLVPDAPKKGLLYGVNAALRQGYVVELRAYWEIYDNLDPCELQEIWAYKASVEPGTASAEAAVGAACDGLHAHTHEALARFLALLKG
jgi:serine/threonine protein kinase